MNVIILIVNGHRVKITTDQPITKEWEEEMIKWIERKEHEAQSRS